jgi:hypothetical protein
VVLMHPQTQELGTRFGACHGGGSVAAEWRWRARGERRGCQEGRGAEVGKTRGDAWKRNPAGGGARGTAPTVSGSGRSRAEEKRRCQRRKKVDRSQKDPFAN